MAVDDNAGQVYSESGAKVINNDNKYVFSYISSILRQIVSFMPWVHQHKYEKDQKSQVITMDEAISQVVTMKESI